MVSAFVSPLLVHNTTTFLRPRQCVKPRSSAAPLKMSLSVLVTGAAGRTGSIVFNLLSSDATKYLPTGLVRDVTKAVTTNELLKGQRNHLIEGDITLPETLLPAMQGKDSLVILTSAIPRKEPPKPDSLPNQPPSFFYDAGGMPEDIDWIGACTQIDLAKSIGLKHVILVGSMGSTEENNMLNKIGNGNILKFKRKAELYLIESGIPYTIINPASLLSDPPSERELIVGKNDELFSIYNRMECGIPRADVARVVVSALTAETAKNKAFDLIAQPKGRGRITVDPSILFQSAYATLS